MPSGQVTPLLPWPFQLKVWLPAFTETVPEYTVWPVELVIVRLAVAGDGAVKVQLAGLFVALESVAALPPIVTLLPMNCSALLQRNQRLQVGIHVDLLLDRGELDELLGELVGIERIERILVLQLRGEEREEFIEIAGELLHAGVSRGRRARR